MLTARESQIVAIICDQGLSGTEIAKDLGISWQTYKKHISNILDKTGYGTVLELAVRTLQKRCKCEYGYGQVK